GGPRTVHAFPTRGSSDLIGPVTLPSSGTYTLKIVAAANLYYTGTYNFRITTNPPAQTSPDAIWTPLPDRPPASAAAVTEAPDAENGNALSCTPGQQRSCI